MKTEIIRTEQRLSEKREWRKSRFYNVISKLKRKHDNDTKEHLEEIQVQMYIKCVWIELKLQPEINRNEMDQSNYDVQDIKRKADERISYFRQNNGIYKVIHE